MSNIFQNRDRYFLLDIMSNQVTIEIYHSKLIIAVLCISRTNLDKSNASMIERNSFCEYNVSDFHQQQLIKDTT